MTVGGGVVVVDVVVTGDRSKIALTRVADPASKEHTGLVEQTPCQPTKCEPWSAAAVRSTRDWYASAFVHWVPQSKPVPVTRPLPEPPSATRTWGLILNGNRKFPSGLPGKPTAANVRMLLIVTVQRALIRLPVSGMHPSPHVVGPVSSSPGVASSTTDESAA